MRILERLLRDEPGSPSELALELDGSLGVVSYHVRCLHGLGLIEIAGRTQVRGALRHDYRLADRAMTIRALARPEDLARITTSTDPSRERENAQRVKQLGQAIRRRRETSAITPTTLAARVGMTPAHLDRIEHGQTDPPSTILIRLADALSTTPADLLTAMTQPPAEGDSLIAYRCARRPSRS